VNRRRPRAGLLVSSLLIAPATWAAAPAVDAELLEFLGSVDSEEGNWSDFLEHTDLDRIAKPAPKAPIKDAAKPPPKGTGQ
jgi:hypothetical protein